VKKLKQLFVELVQVKEIIQVQMLEGPAVDIGGSVIREARRYGYLQIKI
jgi:hypothetical protein